MTHTENIKWMCSPSGNPLNKSPVQFPKSVSAFISWHSELSYGSPNVSTNHFSSGSEHRWSGRTPNASFKSVRIVWENKNVLEVRSKPTYIQVIHFVATKGNLKNGAS